MCLWTNACAAGRNDENILKAGEWSKGNRATAAESRIGRGDVLRLEVDTDARICRVHRNDVLLHEEPDIPPGVHFAFGGVQGGAYRILSPNLLHADPRKLRIERALHSPAVLQDHIQQGIALWADRRNAAKAQRRKERQLETDRRRKEQPIRANLVEMGFLDFQIDRSLQETQAETNFDRRFQRSIDFISQHMDWDEATWLEGLGETAATAARTAAGGGVSGGTDGEGGGVATAEVAPAAVAALDALCGAAIDGDGDGDGESPPLAVYSELAWTHLPVKATHRDYYHEGALDWGGNTQFADGEWEIDNNSCADSTASSGAGIKRPTAHFTGGDGAQSYGVAVAGTPFPRTGVHEAWVQVEALHPPLDLLGVARELDVPLAVHVVAVAGGGAYVVGEGVGEPGKPHHTGTQGGGLQPRGSPHRPAIVHLLRVVGGQGAG